MNLSSKQLISFAGGLLWALTAINSAKAQDIELFIGNAANAALAKPNILLILDDSISMDGSVSTQLSYDPATAYASQGCNAGYVYWSTNGTPPDCTTTDNWFNAAALVCKRAIDTFGIKYGGTYTDVMAQYDPGPQQRWENIDPTEKNNEVECQDDRPDPLSGWAGHGDGSDPAEVYAQNKDPVNLWSSNFNDEVAWGRNPTDEVYTVYSGNYLNWFYGPAVMTTRLAVMKDVASSLVSTINGVNFGLMSFSGNQGGRVRHAMEDATSGRANLLTAIDNLAATNFTPLSETLYEAHQYMRGGNVVYGAGGAAAAINTAPNPDKYNSPINLQCQKNHIVILTDGEPRSDDNADTAIKALSDVNGATFNSLVGNSCDVEAYPAGFNASGGDCLDDLAEYMYEADLSPLGGQQNVTTHTVGFLVNLGVLQDTAERGGGEYRTANDTASLTTALTNIITNILETQSTFTAPAVSINSFNQTRNLDDLYISVFKPSGTTHWPGNLKKYRLRSADATILDANDQPAIDPATGFFSAASQSYWSAGVDGDDIEQGGAANLIPNPREVYTYLGNTDINNASNRIVAANAGITDALLNTGGAGQPTKAQVIDYINGIDSSDVDQDNNVMEPRNQMGDPLHAQPVSVIYGPTTDDARIYFATNDGYLHSIDTVTGVEQWAFLPPEFLDNQVEFFKDNTVNVGQKNYGIDGSLRIQTLANNDGTIDQAAGERVYLFFGMRRGGDVYYGLDVTDPDDPQIMWRLDSNDLPGSGMSWSNAIPARINVGGAVQNAENMVIVIGGGYHPSQDFNFTSTDNAGNSIYIIDSVSGALLWHGSSAGGDKNFAVAGKSMDYSIPADLRVLDLNGDKYADRMYAADMGGQVWRFDILNGQPPATLVNGGVIAQLGAAGLAAPGLADTRRFYYAPDVALVTNDYYNYMHIGIGSGYRAHPTDTSNQNRFFALRDYSTFSAMTQAQYDALTPIVDGDLVDVTHDTAASVPQGSPGWKLQLDDGGWIGEKVLAEARTFNDRVYFTTFRPGAAGIGCQPALGTNREYVMSLFNGAPVTNLDGSVDGLADSEDDRFREWTGAPPPEPVFIFGEKVNRCVDVNCELDEFDNNPKRTWWSQESIE